MNIKYVLIAVLLGASSCAQYAIPPHTIPSAVDGISHPLSASVVDNATRTDGTLQGSLGAGTTHIGDVEINTSADTSITILRSNSVVVVDFSPPLSIKLRDHRFTTATVTQLTYSADKLTAYRIHFSTLTTFTRRDEIVRRALEFAFAPSDPGHAAIGKLFREPLRPQSGGGMRTTSGTALEVSTHQLSSSYQGGTLSVGPVADTAVITVVTRTVDNATKFELTMLGADLTAALHEGDDKFNINHWALRAPTRLSAMEADGTTPSAEVTATDIHSEPAASLAVRVAARDTQLAVSGDARVSAQSMNLTISAGYNLTLDGATISDLNSLHLQVPHATFDATGVLAAKGRFSFGTKTECECEVIGTDIAGTAILHFDSGMTLTLKKASVPDLLVQFNSNDAKLFARRLTASADASHGIPVIGGGGFALDTLTVNADLLLVGGSLGMTAQAVTYTGYTSPNHKPDTEASGTLRLESAGLTVLNSSHGYVFHVRGDNQSDTILKYRIIQRNGHVKITELSLDPITISHTFDEGAKIVDPNDAVSAGFCKGSNARYYTYIFDVGLQTQRLSIKEQELIGATLDLKLPATAHLNIPGGHGQYDDRDDPSKGFRAHGSRPWRDYQQVSSDTFDKGPGECTFNKYIAPQGADASGNIHVYVGANATGKQSVSVGSPTDFAMPALDDDNDDEQNGCWQRPTGLLDLCSVVHFERYLGRRLDTWKPALVLQAN